MDKIQILILLKNEHIEIELRYKEILADIYNTKCLKDEKEYYIRK